MDNEMRPLTDDELMAEQATALPDKEVASVLDLNADLDLGINAAAPIDLAVAANANVAAPIDAAASANILSFGSDAQALSHQDAAIDQGIVADANANSAQDSVIGQGDGTTGADAGTAGTTDAGTTAPAGTAPAPTSTGGVTDAAGALNGNLLNVDVNLDADGRHRCSDQRCRGRERQRGRAHRCRRRSEHRLHRQPVLRHLGPERRHLAAHRRRRQRNGRPAVQPAAVNQDDPNPRRAASPGGPAVVTRPWHPGPVGPRSDAGCPLSGAG